MLVLDLIPIGYANVEVSQPNFVKSLKDCIFIRAQSAKASEKEMVPSHRPFSTAFCAT